MADLNLDLDYFDHPKTMRLVGILGKGAAEFPIRLWAFVGKFHAADGRLMGYGAGEIESVLRWWGDPGDLVAAMARVGFLDKDGDGWRVHGWEERQGHIEAMKVRGRTAAHARWEKLRGQNGQTDAQALQQALPLHSSSNAPTVPTVPTTPTLLDSKSKTGGAQGPEKPPFDLPGGGVERAEPTIPVAETTPPLSKEPPNAGKPPSPGRKGGGGDVEIPLDLLGSETPIRTWLAYKAEKGGRYKPLGLQALWGKLRGMKTPERIAAAVKHSMEHNWSGLFEPKGGFDGEARAGRSGKTGGGFDPERKAGLAGLSRRSQMQEPPRG